MTALLTPNTLRAFILAFALACVAAFTAPTARGDDMRARSVSDGSSGTPSLMLRAWTDNAVLADEFSWHDFIRFWQRQMGSMSGVVGTVLLVAGLAFLIIMSKGRA